MGVGSERSERENGARAWAPSEWGAAGVPSAHQCPVKPLACLPPPAGLPLTPSVSEPSAPSPLPPLSLTPRRGEDEAPTAALRSPQSMRPSAHGAVLCALTLPPAHRVTTPPHLSSAPRAAGLCLGLSGW